MDFMGKKISSAWAVIGLAAVAVILLATCHRPGATASDDSDNGPRPGFPVQTTLLKAEKVETVGSDYTLERAADGGTLVVVEYTMKNIGSTPVKSYDVPSVTLVDPRGTIYNSDAGKTGSLTSGHDEFNRKLLSDLNPDITIRDALVFEVSKAQFNPETWTIHVSDGEDFQFPPPNATPPSVTPATVSPSTFAASSAQAPAGVQAILDRYDDLNEECRGGSHSPDDQVCKDRDAAGDELEAHGWCYGEGATSGADSVWAPCKH